MSGGWQPFDGGQHSRNYCGGPECGGSWVTAGVKLWDMAGLVAIKTLCLADAEAALRAREATSDLEDQEQR